MKALIFNIHDVILLLTICFFGLLSAFSFANQYQPKQVRHFLSLFFLTNGLMGIHTLIYWGDAIRYRVFDIFPFVYLLLSGTSFILGPLIYWLTCASVRVDFRVTKRHLLHLLPALLAPVYLYMVCFRFDVRVQRELFLNFGLFNQAGVFFSEYQSLEKFWPFIYGVICLRILVCHHQKPKAGLIAKKTGSLDILIIGLLVIWSWAIVTHFWGRFYSKEVSDLMGIAGNYFSFILALFLFYDHLLNLVVLRNREKEEQGVEEDKPGLNLAHVDKILSAMISDKVFLNSQLTLDRFAEIVELSPREVSTVINRKFQQNFHEFINGYRLEEAKKMLRDPSQSASTIYDIAQASGFNSKATFNRLFKKLVSVTPSDYRLKYQAD